MPSQSIYKVGGHCFALEYPKEMLSEKELTPYAPFRTDSCLGEDKLFTLSVTDVAGDTAIEGGAIADLNDENGGMTLFKKDDGTLTIHLTTVLGFGCGCISISKDYRSAKAWIAGTPRERRYALDTALMLQYAFASSKRDTLLLHASTVEQDGTGYLFLGKSGTGKSTHSRLWIEHIPGSELINDDNPIIRIEDKKAYVYGSPWSGKTSCYRNRKIPVGGIIRLRQAPKNRITHMTGLQAYATLLPSCSYMRWDREMSEAIHSTISEVLEKAPVFGLECRPDREAALMCHDELIKLHSAGTGGLCNAAEKSNG